MFSDVSVLLFRDWKGWGRGHPVWVLSKGWEQGVGYLADLTSPGWGEGGGAVGHLIRVHTSPLCPDLPTRPALTGEKGGGDVAWSGYPVSAHPFSRARPALVGRGGGQGRGWSLDQGIHPTQDQRSPRWRGGGSPVEGHAPPPSPWLGLV